jgi:hypothetical protein
MRCPWCGWQDDRGDDLSYWVWGEPGRVPVARPIGWRARLRAWARRLARGRR